MLNAKPELGHPPGDLRTRGPVQCRSRGRQHRSGPGRRAGAGADGLPLPEQVRVHLAPGRRGICLATAGPRPHLAALRRAGTRERLRPELARAGAAPRWRLRRLPGRRLEPGDHGLGGAWARERRSQPARPSTRRPVADRLPALAGRRAALHWRPRAHNPGARGRRGQPAQVWRSRPGGRASQATLARFGQSSTSHEHIATLGLPGSGMHGAEVHNANCWRQR